jgi:DNA-binding transcriptional ArsR family regulator
MSVNGSLTDRNGGSEQLSKDVIFSMLSNPRRRYVIRYLKSDPGPVRIRDLAQQIAAWENDVDVSDLTYKQRKRVYTSLHQTHLPKLDEAGVVDYDRDRGTIELADRAAELDIYLEVVSKHDIPWSDYYLGLSALVLLLLAATWFDVFPFSIVPDLLLAGGITVLFALSAVVHSYYTHRSHVGGDVSADD